MEGDMQLLSNQELNTLQLPFYDVIKYNSN